MNLMFRKNFDKAAGGGGGGGGGIGGGGIGGGIGGIDRAPASGLAGACGAGSRGPLTGPGARRSGQFGGESDYGAGGGGYRTHLLFSPLASSNANADDYPPPGPGPARRTSGGPHLIKWGQSNANANAMNNNVNTQSNNVNNNVGGGAPQPMQRRKHSQAIKDMSFEQPLTPTRQVSFTGKQRGGSYILQQHQQHQPSNSPARSEPISLATLDRDCFIIPLAALERFLPAGVPTVPSADKKRPGSPLSILEVEDPKQCILAHFMTQLEPLEPLVESPVNQPLVLQRDTAAELLSELAPTALQSILLTNMERNADFPFITYYVVNKQKTDPVDFYQEVQCAALKKFDPRDLRYAVNHNLDLFNEVATIARPPLEPPGGRPPIPTTGYIVSIFKVFEGDDGPKFERNWLYWTGARMMYRYLPKCVGLRRITLHKSMSNGDKMYLLVCECSQLQENLSAAAILLPALRARLCGYVGLYRPSVCF